MTTEEQLAGLRQLCKEPELRVEGGISYVVLAQIKVTVAGSVRVVDALLCAGAHNGYTTRLFLSQPFPERAANWSQWVIFGRNWHTWSWQNVPADIPWIQMVLEHLRALR